MPAGAARSLSVRLPSPPVPAGRPAGRACRQDAERSHGQRLSGSPRRSRRRGPWCRRCRRDRGCGCRPRPAPRDRPLDRRAAASFSPRWSSIIAPDQIWPIGLAMPRPAMSGAEPCTGSNIDGYSRSGLMLADGAMPIEPTQAGPRSDRMSPNRLEPTTTSNQSGCRTKCAVRMSMWYWSVLTSGYSRGDRREALVPVRHRVDDAVRLGRRGDVLACACAPARRRSA